MKNNKLKFKRNETFFNLYNELFETKLSKTEFKKDVLNECFPDLTERKAYARFDNYQMNKTPMPFLVYEKFMATIQKYISDEKFNSSENGQREYFSSRISENDRSF